MFKNRNDFLEHIKRANLLVNIKTVFDREPWWAEFWSAIACIGWSVISISSNQSLSDRPALAILSMIAVPKFWEITGFFIGFFQFSALITGCHFGRRSAAFVAGWWWFFLTLSITLLDPAAPSIALYAVFGAINIFSMLKLAGRYA